MLKGLARLLGISQKVEDIGPVPITINLNPEVSDQDVQQLKDDLQGRGIVPGGYASLAEGQIKILSCSAPRGV